MLKRVAQVVSAAVVLSLAVAGAASAGGCGAGECYEKVHAPDVYQTVAHPVVVAPARTEVVHTPAVYGSVARQVEVAPARAWHSVTPALYGTRQREVVVQPGGWRWQHTVDRHGRERLCKVYVAPVTSTVTEKVLLEPARRVTHVAPAVYREEHRTVVLKAAESHVVHHPAVVGVRHRDVLVRRGGWHWQRTW